MHEQKIAGNKTEKVRLLQTLLEQDLRVFSTATVKQFSRELGIDQAYSLNIISALVREEWLTPLKKGVYKLSRSTGASPIHEFEIAMGLVSPAMISYYSAFYHHGLTDQVPRIVYVSTLKAGSTVFRKGSQNSKFSMEGVEYRVIQLKNEKFFGSEKAWRGEGTFWVADLERTLIEGFASPHYCGGFREVMYGLQEAFPKLNLEKLIHYALQWDIAVGRRIGWALEELEVKDERILKLVQSEHPGYRRLDASSTAKGHYSNRWRLQINL
jgi:predicted transcriptional regulator of viral defense system